MITLLMLVMCMLSLLQGAFLSASQRTLDTPEDEWVLVPPCRWTENSMRHIVTSEASDYALLVLLDGKDIRGCDEKGATLMHYAVLLGNVVMMHALKKLGAETSSQDNQGFSLLHYAACCRSEQVEEVIATLVGWGHPINCVTGRGYTPLFVAARRHNLRAVRALLAGGVLMEPRARRASFGDAAGVDYAALAASPS